MPVLTRYRITDAEVRGVKSFPTLTEIPYFLSHHGYRLRSIGNLVVTVSNRKAAHPNYIRVNAFHRHHTFYAAIDALAPPLAEFFEHTDILPLVNPIFARFEEDLKRYDYHLAQIFAQHGILIPRLTAR